MERTFAMIKPDATERGIAGKIISRIEEEGFRILGMRLINMTKAQAEGFYAVHRERPFFGDLTSFMSSGPTVVLALEREEAIRHWRDVMGATNPEEAAAGSIRKEFGESIERNSTHGSDAPDTAAFELGYWFPGVEIP
ncbi:MAG: nucleoside-diphosphate kinase [Nitrospinota bacterium]|jgi:nucleoside-diphosphate kinase|nr:nucleoside-diphosphate kinase [Nitrospinota bacterium]MDP6277669.1 nucleoside-diphosphate kinase [Nitrospinota bacterium]MDP6365865.1 nucleoside-diphosphate kinase [Nitrospinota bacterium]MDP7167141.1 nucleoside-diphosphate kinase [Nitrospinota bacterium]MDP7369755.1 nucleoside-diphosphate kinase [Nitrospinota bacterium]|tara:strand:- start:202 stop:615 length:414 start_codon:yes stop_codon:yes gene_type:complete